MTADGLASFTRSGVDGRLIAGGHNLATIQVIHRRARVALHARRL